MRATVRKEFESRSFGTSWTINEKYARSFVVDQRRVFPNLDSPPVILRARILRENIVAMLFERQESEVLADPADLFDVTAEDVKAKRHGGAS